MPITGTPRVYVDVAAPPRTLGGIFAWANILDASDPHMQLGIEYETVMCREAAIWADLCTPAPATPCNPGGSTLTKDFSKTSVVVGDPFVATAGIHCNSFSAARNSENLANARLVLEYTEDRVVEQQLLVAATSFGTALTGGPLHLTVAELEQWLDLEYAGQGLIHMSRQAAVHARSQQLVFPGLDGRLRTVNGTPVANGRGYYGATDGLMVFATGQVTLTRGPVLGRAVDEVTLSPTECAPARALAERIWSHAVECGYAYAQGTVV